MRYLSVCSGIEAATAAWHPLGWEPVAFSEVDAFSSAVLHHHYPTVPNLGDMTRFKDWPDAALDLLVGGTPCQSFSVAGLRKGLADPRGNLALTFLAIADRYRPRWLVWENVPGVLSADSHDDPDPRPPSIDLDGDNGPADGTTVVVEDEYDADETHAFACFLAGLSELGYGFAYRALDAQHFGLAQRRKRVFVVGCLGSWQRATAVLFERASLSGHPAPSREARQVAPSIPSRRTAGGGLGTDFDCDGGLIAADVAATLDAAMSTTQSCSMQDVRHGLSHLVAFDARQSDVITYGNQAGPLDTDGHSIGVAIPSLDGAKGRGDRGTSRDGCAIGNAGDPMFTLRAVSQHAIAFSVKDHGADAGDIAPTLRAGGHTSSHANGGVMPAVAFEPRYYTRDNKTGGQPSDIAVLKADAAKAGDSAPHVAAGMAVRRLTPRECERLQGFPDDYTLIPYRGKPAADGPRYKALGNSMAVPVMAWIGRRMQMVDEIA